MRAVLVAVVAAALAFGCGEDEPPTAPGAGRVIDADDGSYERVVEQAEGPVLVLFWARWSGPDRTVLPYLDDAARERPGLTVVKVDVDEAPATAGRFDVGSVPTAMVLVDGKVRREPVSGVAPQAQWEQRLGLDAVAPRAGSD